MAKILLIHSRGNILPLKDFFLLLNEKGHKLNCYTTDKKTKRIFSEGNINTSILKIHPNINNIWFRLLFIFLWPFYLLFSLFWTFILKYRCHYTAIICFSDLGRFLLPLWCKIFKIKLITMKLENVQNKKIPLGLRLGINIMKTFTKEIVFNNYQKEQIITKKKSRAKKITVLPFATGISHLQDNIFNKLAAGNQATWEKKFFSLGTILDLNKEHAGEHLFQAVKDSLEVIPNIQLIIIGEGEERKKLSWLAKKMEINHLVWFVGEQKILKKWLANLDIYLIIAKHLNLVDLFAMHQAMAAGLPIIAPETADYEEIFTSEINALLVHPNDKEALTQAIIRLRRKKELRKKLGEAGKKLITEKYTLDNMLKEFEKILKQP
ncbi:glycosyltransferase family 4 protein [Candidatus Parcubacteria bacterium]|nr:glycosyltransferase family 4 protein [Candidatus Parcubacteria bacterium]